MILVIKKITCLIAVLAVMLSVSVYAHDEFLVYGQDDIEGICQALNMEAGEINDYCKENNITYLAVNPANTKQIRKTVIKDAFSQKIGNLSVLSDKDILCLSGQLSSVENAIGEVVTRNSQKFLKIEVKSTDSGGEYILTQYVTVADSQKTVLSFYTDTKEDTAYIDEVFNSQFVEKNTVKYIVVAGVAVFSLLAIAVLALIVRDILLKRNNK